MQKQYADEFIKLLEDCVLNTIRLEVYIDDGGEHESRRSLGKQKVSSYENLSHFLQNPDIVRDDL